MVLSTKLAALVASLPFVLAATKKLDFHIRNDVVSPDGFERRAITVNGIFPGTPVILQKNDKVQINTINELTDPGMRRSTSIHWHGLFQHKTSGMDGPSFVNQCPIPPNSTFLYDFDTAGQTGNYWYHSHLSTQYCDGLRGSFIVYDPNDPLKHLYDVDDESTIITLADWYHDLAPHAQNQFFQTGSVPIPDTGLINGVGRFKGGPLVPYAVINVEQGKRYRRFRLIQISCRPFFTFSIDNHTFDAIEFDGIEHDPTPAQNIDIYAAQRASIIVHANQTIDNYWIRAPLTGGNPAGNPNLDISLIRAILRYKGAPAVEPTTVATTGGHKLNDADMHPIAQEGPGNLGTGPPDMAITLNIAQPNPPFFDINGISYLSPSVPVLLQMLSGARKPQDFLPSEQVIILPANKLIEVSIPGAGAHPFHLHGHTFDIVRTSNSDVVNLVNPPRRDVLPINGGNTTFRFFSGNSGAWFLHCHIDWHLEAGLAVVFAERPAEVNEGEQAQIVTQDWRTLCPAYDGLAPEFQ
ncbi:laccase [Pleurotus ostreatus]|uniref:Laccase n=1 Tax=Pleurotus ostreatus TaxID=5322 RepID=A0A8H6ZPX7_PLEOS|nr:laccase [Pleurotus ostreatus]KAF7424252.1 laccase [Pleurotus ostreatus]